jgi:DNA-binding transcriptional LysR family regulator
MDLRHLRHLRCFLAVAEELHFARAAEKLHIEQSPLSRAIKELEEELGVALFARTTRSTRLTRAGKLFFGRVCRALPAGPQTHSHGRTAALSAGALLSVGVLRTCATG